MEIINFLIFLLFRLLFLFFRLLPRNFVLFLGSCLGRMVYGLSLRHRRIAYKNLDIAFGPTMGKREKGRLARQAFAHFGRMILDTVKFASLDHRRRSALISLEAEENLRQALSSGQGVLIFSAHLGNWEVASWAVSRLAPLHVVARPLDNPWLEKELLRLRQRLGAKVISKFQAAKPILRALQAGEMVAILIDQNVLRSQAVFVDFFGRPAATTPSLASFHLRSRAPIVPVFCLMKPDRRYVVKIYPPLTFLPGKLPSADGLQITGHCIKMIEQEIRLNPGQWLWFHDRWRTRPAEEMEAEIRNSKQKGPKAGE